MTTTLVRRPSRVAPPTVPEVDLTIADPPAHGPAQNPLAMAGMMLMPLAGGAGSVAMAVTQQGRPVYVVVAFFALVASIALGVIMIVSQRSGHKRQVREARERYLDYLEAMRNVVREQIAAQRAEQAWRFPRADQLLDVCLDDARRWERRRGDADFMTVRLGTGDVPLACSLTLNADTGPLNQLDPVCLHAARELQERYGILHAQPITMALGSLDSVSIVGAPDARRELASQLLAQLAALHGPGDLSIALVRSESAAAAWDWVKWLPHVVESAPLDGAVPARRIAQSVAELGAVLAGEFEQRLDRAQRARGQAAGHPQRLVVIVDTDTLPAGQHLELPDPSYDFADLGVHVISLVDTPRAEPETVRARITLLPDGTAGSTTWPAPFAPDRLPHGAEYSITRALSPLRLTAEDEIGEELTGTVGLPEILGVDDPARLDPRLTWRRRPLRDFLRVPIGIGERGSTVLLDLKESAHGGMGPHGLVVGATGSGKSEMLRTLVASLVINHGPDELALMLVDFKGGATFAPLEGIPHLAGMITNIEDDLTLVDRMAVALDGEMERRQALLKRAGNLPNVSAYRARRDAGEDLEPLPNLLVIVDEFSELLTAEPDFADLFVRIGRVGRSIGVHLLLASQRLETGKIRGLESHLSYRIGLRTFSEGESRDAIGSPDAYHLPPEPGGGFLRVDTTVFERFKAAMVSGPYVPAAQAAGIEVPVVPFVATNGIGLWLEQQADLAARADTERHVDEAEQVGATRGSVLDLICDHLIAAGAPRAGQVWLDPLPARLTLPEVADPEAPGAPGTMTALLGRVDDPARQAQFPLEYDFTASTSNLVIAGSGSSGKSMLLQTMMLSLALRYEPGQIVMYAIDYGGGHLTNLKDLPHVASVATRSSPELISRTLNEVIGLLEKREALFAEHGLTSVRQLREARAQGRIPQDVPADVFFIIDGWGVFRDDHEHLDAVVTGIAARGQNFGIHVALTVIQAMQVRMRMQAAFGGRLELRLNDALEAQSDRQLVGQISRETPGRGVSEFEERELLFQAAMPSLTPLGEEEQADAGLADAVAAATARWEGVGVRRVSTLPTLVRTADIGLPDPGTDVVPIGLSELNLAPAGPDLFGVSPHLFVLGDSESGRTNVLKLLARGLMATRSSDKLSFFVVDPRRTLQGLIPPDYLVAYATSADEAVQTSAVLVDEIRKRVPGADVTADQLRARSWWKGMDLVVLADDLDLLTEGNSCPISPFAPFAQQGRDLGLHVVFSRRVGGIGRSMHEPLMQKLMDMSTPGVLLSSSTETIRINNVPSRPMQTGRAMFVSRTGGASQLQLALLDEAESLVEES